MLLEALVGGHCSCELYRAPGDAEKAAAEDEQFRQKARRKGWSRAKTQRALEARRPALEHRAARSDDASRLYRALAETVRAIGAIRLFAHSSSGERNVEVVPAAERTAFSLAEWEANGFAFPSETLAEVRR